MPRPPRIPEAFLRLALPLAAVLAACDGDSSTDPAIEPPDPLGGTAAEVVAARAAVDDAASRLLPAFGSAAGAADLGAALRSLADDVTRRDRASVVEHVDDARRALGALDAAGDVAVAPDLSAVRLVVLELERLLAAPTSS